MCYCPVYAVVQIIRKEVQSGEANFAHVNDKGSQPLIIVCYPTNLRSSACSKSTSWPTNSCPKGFVM